MSLRELKQQAARLPSKKQRQLIAFLVSLQVENQADFKRKLAAKIDDNDPENWISLDQLKQRWAER